MSDPNIPQVIAVLRAIEERLSEMQRDALDPEGRVQQAQNDTLRAYGLIAQVAEIMGIQRDQIMALSDAIGILVARFVEHDRKVSAQHAAMLELLHALANAVGMAEIAAAAERAREVLHAAEEERLAELALAADSAKELLDVARMDAKSLINQALNRAGKDDT